MTHRPLQTPVSVVVSLGATASGVLVCNAAWAQEAAASASAAVVAPSVSAFTDGNTWIGGMSRLFGESLIGGGAVSHPLAPTVPESVRCLFQLSFAIVPFAIVLGATVERMRLGRTALFAALWTALVYSLMARVHAHTPLWVSPTHAA